VLEDPMAWFDTERFSLRAAVSQAAGMGLDECCWELAIACVALYESRGLFDEWRDTHMIALQAVTEAGNRRGRAAVLASLGSLGIAQRSAGDEQMLLESLALFEEVGDVLGQATALRELAHMDRIKGQPDRAIERYERALEGFRSVGDKGAEAHVLSGLSRAYLDLGSMDTAEELAKEALIMGQRLDSGRLQAQGLLRLGEVLMSGLQLLAAKAVFQQALELTRGLGDRVGQAYALAGLGSAVLQLSDSGSARSCFTQAADICVDVQERNIHAHALLGLARVFASDGDQVQAEHHFLQAASSFAAQANKAGQALVLEELHRFRSAMGLHTDPEAR
jgi:tetratricopeptide (TPR) repeat protein